ncbi:uncharacterized protein PHALS_14391 [Plasmopara halstedii]|uniref:Uncharacterized protein n=1 Tax=Plasmopara halstedii TaxID=4781 RepID=A0A0P1ARC6_PLAHL|nr:uncharacterized protein PHALS_14391 [Plasmopara halstedii]CEG44129.1 hypothetical protein PHALS_14391 [Plasmopara halstedii]|eukprot:XP_024580498.1 hypothetical protein PHALS_14391 [Plasmopara halstedii]
MLETPFVIKDAPTSQDTKKLVPMSLSLVVKKEKILQMKAAKLDKLLSQRKNILDDLQKCHENLLMKNGQLQERSHLRRDKLASLRAFLEEHCRDDRPALCDAIGANELTAIAEKCYLMKDVLFGLADKRAGLEQQCMEFEEHMTREKGYVEARAERLCEARSTLGLLLEDMKSTQWNIASDQVKLDNEEHYLNAIREKMRCQNVIVEEYDFTFKAKKAEFGDAWHNYECMVQEEYRHLMIANEDARSIQQEFQKLLEENGATCLVDKEEFQLANDLRIRQHELSEKLANVKMSKRELGLRQKQEKRMLAITQSSMKAKIDQLTWLNRQCVQFTLEKNEATRVYSAHEAAYSSFRENHNVAMTTLDLQIKDAEKHIKTTERAIVTRNKKVSALNKKVLQRTRILQEWQAKMNEKQDAVLKLAPIQELLNAENLSLQEALECAQRREEELQQLNTSQEVESLKLRESCAALEAEIQQMHTTMSMLNDRIHCIQTVVKNRIDDIREKFLHGFVADDAKNLRQLLDKEIISWVKKATDEVNAAVACEVPKLKEKYKILAAETRKKFGKMTKQKEKDYKAKIDKLKTLGERNTITSIGTQGKIANQAHQDNYTTDHDEKNETRKLFESDDKSNEAKMCRLVRNETGVCKQSSSAEQPSSQSHSTQRKAKEESEQAPKSARRQLALGLTLVDESHGKTKERKDVFSAETAAASLCQRDDPGVTTYEKQRSRCNVARHSRLKRRSQAQKTGKTAAMIIPPELPVVIEKSCDVTRLHQDVIEMEALYHRESPVGCDDNFAVSTPAKFTDTVKTTSTIASQGAAKKQPKQKVRKGTSKRRTSTKASHRSRQAKWGHCNLGHSQLGVRSVDWSAADTFSFD